MWIHKTSSVRVQARPGAERTIPVYEASRLASASPNQTGIQLSPISEPRRQRCAVVGSLNPPYLSARGCMPGGCSGRVRRLISGAACASSGALKALLVPALGAKSERSSPKYRMTYAAFLPLALSAVFGTQRKTADDAESRLLSVLEPPPPTALWRAHAIRRPRTSC